MKGGRVGLQNASPAARMASFLQDSFKQFNINVSVTMVAPSFDRMKSACLNSKPFVIFIEPNHPYYSYYHVAGYAYTRLQNNSSGYYKSYVKVADGWASAGRYIDMATIIAGGHKMYPVTR